MANWTYILILINFVLKVFSFRDESFYINRWAHRVSRPQITHHNSYEYPTSSPESSLFEIQQANSNNQLYYSDSIYETKQQDIDLADITTEQPVLSIEAPQHLSDHQAESFTMSSGYITSNVLQSTVNQSSIAYDELLDVAPSSDSLVKVSGPSLATLSQLPSSEDIINTDYGQHIKTFPGSTILSRFKEAVLPLFSFIQVTPSPCTSATGDNGTCLNHVECKAFGGTGSGSCASGFGTCCVFQLSCGNTVSQNCTYFVNSNYPQSVGGDSSCQLTINKLNSDICQIRLDFLEFTMDGPDNTDHSCDTDSFKVLGSVSAPTICGTNTGNHMYVTMGPGVTTPPVLMAITRGTNVARKWKIKISQIPCSASYAAPSNCLQYHTGVQGTVQSYNYNAAAGLQLSNQDYSICIRDELNFCGIRYTACTDPTSTTAGTSNSFTIGSSTSGGNAGVGTASCSRDWIIIPCVSNNALTPTSNCVDRLCGFAFNNVGGQATSVPLYSFVKPFTIFHHTNDLEGSETTFPESNNRGFCLNYSQQPC